MVKLDKNKFLQLLKLKVESEFNTLSDFAEFMGVSVSFISAVLSGKKTPSKSILDYMGFEKIREVSFFYYSKTKSCTCSKCEHDFEALPVPDGEFITCPLCKSKLTPNGQGDL